MPPPESHPETSASPGEAPVLVELLESLRPRIQSILGRYRIPEADAEDLLQDTCLLFVLRGHRIENPPAWFAATLANRCCMYWRTAHRDRRRFTSLEGYLSPGQPGQPGRTPAPASGAGPRSPAERLDHRLDAAAALRRLPRRQASLLVLRHGLGFSYKEVAAALGYEVQSVNRTMARAYARLRKLFQRS